MKTYRDYTEKEIREAGEAAYDTYAGMSVEEILGRWASALGPGRMIAGLVLLLKEERERKRVD